MKAEVKCGVVCHGGDGNSESDCPTITAPHLRSHKGLWVRDRDKEGESSKMQRRGTAVKGIN